MTADRREEPATALRKLRDYANVLRFDQGALDSDQWRYLHFCIDQYAIEREAQGDMEPAPPDVERLREGEPCTCGFEKMRERWKASILSNQPSTEPAPEPCSFVAYGYRCRRPKGHTEPHAAAPIEPAQGGTE